MVPENQTQADEESTVSHHTTESNKSKTTTPRHRSNGRVRITLSALAAFSTLAAATLETASADQRRFIRRNGRTTLRSLGAAPSTGTTKNTNRGTILRRSPKSSSRANSIRTRMLPKTDNKIYKTLPIVGLKVNRSHGGLRGTSASASIRKGLMVPGKSNPPPNSRPRTRRTPNGGNRGNWVPAPNCQQYTVRYQMRGRKTTPMISRKFAFRYANYLQSLGFEVGIINVNGIDYVEYHLQGAWQIQFRSHTAAHVFEKWLTLKGVDAKVIHN